ncbi:MAG: 2-oxoglutarate ferredoxin oxidoreductase subunit alpha, partial [Alphaproteobacteria bacterium]|nr:2-oxoglutarate ferredoxin oxidoreductase subunit alpha [Alphaproteobacteria bacterium]
GDTAELFVHRYQIPKADIPAGKYRRVTGNEAISLGLATAATLAGKNLVYASYPITPASDILHNLAMMKNYGVKTIQAEDEIAACCAAIGAAYAGQIAVTGTSGPGICLKSEAIGLAVMTELPLVVIDVQRGGPSTGLPTKVEQADLLQAFYGRNGESPVVILAPRSPTDCFDIAIEAVRLAFGAMAPVFILSDGYMANGAEPWRIPDASGFEPIDLPQAPQVDPDGRFLPYQRDQHLRRPWIAPGMAGYEHRLGGLEKQHETGDVAYGPENHQRMTDIRREKIENLARFIPAQAVEGPQTGELLLVSWGGTYGAVTTAAMRARQRGQSVATCHLRWLNPFPRNLGAILGRYKHVLVPELNMGQLRLLLRDRFLVDARGLNKVQGQPFLVDEVSQAIDLMLDGRWGDRPYVEPQAHQVPPAGSAGSAA